MEGRLIPLFANMLVCSLNSTDELKIVLRSCTVGVSRTCVHYQMCTFPFDNVQVNTTEK